MPRPFWDLFEAFIDLSETHFSGIRGPKARQILAVVGGATISGSEHPEIERSAVVAVAIQTAP